MARIRSIKPEMRKSLTVSGWPIPVRWTFVGLIGYVDDYGRGVDDTRLIKAELYPLDDGINARRVEEHLAMITESETLCRYEAAGRRFIHFPKWSDHQKVSHPTDSRFAPCDRHDKDQEAAA